MGYGENLEIPSFLLEKSSELQRLATSILSMLGFGGGLALDILAEIVPINSQVAKYPCFRNAPAKISVKKKEVSTFPADSRLINVNWDSQISILAICLNC